mmetsp:Transcript_36770/g.94901  ORF Transcript_36770/g.94901 Transcript_36770/m.94901 type:complete len:261 (-) Transcript_36770:7-789(-)
MCWRSKSGRSMPGLRGKSSSSSSRCSRKWQRRFRAVQIAPCTNFSCRVMTAWKPLDMVRLGRCVSSTLPCSTSPCSVAFCAASILPSQRSRIKATPLERCQKSHSRSCASGQPLVQVASATRGCDGAAASPGALQQTGLSRSSTRTSSSSPGSPGARSSSRSPPERSPRQRGAAVQLLLGPHASRCSTMGSALAIFASQSSRRRVRLAPGAFASLHLSCAAAAPDATPSCTFTAAATPGCSEATFDAPSGCSATMASSPG